jgi:group I intron endonuclease
MEIYIYKLIDPITNEIRYVGKTKNSITKRLYEHLTVRNLKSNNHKNNWIKQLLKSNNKPKIEVLEVVNEDNWIPKEIYWIKFLKENGCNLTNTSDGGEGSFGYKMTKESIEKSLNTRKANNTLKRSDECKNLISKSKLGKKLSKEHIESVASKLRKKILQYDLNGSLIKEWEGIRVCARELGLNHRSIITYLDSNKPLNGFIWKRL